MKTADFDFRLPKEYIASRPSEKRDHSRLLVLGKDGSIEHRRFHEITEYLNPGDLLLLNNTKVFPARITGTKPSGGKIDILLVREADEKGTWEILYKGGFQGTVTVLNGMEAEIRLEGGGSARALLKFPGLSSEALDRLLWDYGAMPLPPYIRRAPDKEDKLRYQTVYAERQGSIAAPTAGLHFTGELLAGIKEKGVKIRALTLHVGSGTFKPIRAELLAEHRMDSEYFELEPSLLEDIRNVKKAGGRLITVGTTATRAIEGYMSGKYKGSNGASPSSTIKGSTDIFISPGYEFRAVDC
ncbi:MAG TPA: tRNA preQ1(34) S-adenosylmethionine ribosyltransferase-isomerase QueA, partial [Dissulfurispiraceae bacterium]